MQEDLHFQTLRLRGTQVLEVSLKGESILHESSWLGLNRFERLARLGHQVIGDFVLLI